MYLPPPSALPPGSIVDSYRRDSGGSRQDQSTDQQLTEIQAFCKKHNLVLRHNFVDEARSGGSTAGRDDFNRMIDLYRIPDQRPNGLILWNYARFARDFDNAVYYKSLIRTYKITIHSLNDQIPEGDYGRIVEFFIDMSNEEKRRQTSADAKRGLRDLVKKYGCVPGTPPTGFKRKPVHIGQRRDGSPHVAHRWVPDPKVTPRIKQAFQMRSAGSTLKAIHKAARLFTSINSYKSFFTNRIYIGILEFGDLVIEDYCKPIVDIKTWNAVQKIVADYAKARTTERHPRRASSTYLLSGLIRCWQCGAPMNGNTVSRHHITGRDEAYRCSQSRRTDKCTAGRIARRPLEAKILQLLKDEILTPENLKAIHHVSLEARMKFEAEHQARAESLTAEKAKVAAQIANITKAIAERGPLQPLLDKLTELTAQRAQITADLKEASTPLQPLPHLADDQLVAVSKGFQRLVEKGTPDQVKTLLQAYVKSVIVERQGKRVHGTLTYYYPPPPFEFAPTGGIMLPISSLPVGAPLYRQAFTLPFSYETSR